MFNLITLPVSKDEEKFEFIPVSLNRIYFIAGVLLVLSVAVLIIGITLKAFVGFWILAVVGGVGIFVTLIYFIYNARRVLTGAIEHVILDSTGIRVLKKNELVQELNWEEIDTYAFIVSEIIDGVETTRFVTQEAYDADDSFQLSDIDTDVSIPFISKIVIVQKEKEEKSLEIDLHNYATLKCPAKTIVSEFESAYKFFKKKHEEKMATNP